MKGKSEEAAGTFHHPPGPSVEEVGIEPSYGGLTGHAYLKGKI